MAFLRSVYGKSNDHVQATYELNTGKIQMGLPSVGSWVTYGLGSTNEDLPSFVVLLSRGRTDQPIWIARKHGAPLALRLVAIKKPEQAAAESRRKAHLAARKERRQLSMRTIEAADWVILVTSLTPKEVPTDDIIALYRLRWRIELGFKRLKSLVGLKGPPGFDERSAKPYILAHLLMILLIEPLIGALDDSPHWVQAA